MNTRDRQANKLLLVEDDPGHALLIQKNLRRMGIIYDIEVLGNGCDAVDYLLKQGAYTGDGSLPPVLVLLDLNLPGLNGYQVLKIIRNEHRTKLIPVVVLTTADDPEEVSLCYGLGCNMYISKPLDPEQFAETIQRLSAFLSIVKTPKTE